MKLQDLLQDHQLFHSQFQQDYFITLKAGGTLYGQYKQALRELYKRFRGLRETICDKRIAEIKIKRLKQEIEKETDEFKKEIKQIQYERRVMQMEEAQRVVDETKREFIRFYQQACVLKEEIEKKYGKLNEEVRNKLDREMWMYRVKEMIATDVACTGHISSRTYEIINIFPQVDRNNLIRIIRDKNEMAKVIAWYENKNDQYQIDYDHLPEADKLYSDDEILKLK